MKPAKARSSDDLGGWIGLRLHSAHRGGSVLQRQVRPVVEVVRDEAGQKALEVFLVQDDDVVEQIAAMTSRWLARKVHHRCRASECAGRRDMQRETVRSETSRPSFRISPWMRGAPHVGFSAAIRWTGARISAVVLGRPAWRRDVQRQYRLKPSRCQRMTVAG